MTYRSGVGGFIKTINLKVDTVTFVTHIIN